MLRRLRCFIFGHRQGVLWQSDAVYCTQCGKLLWTRVQEVDDDCTDC